MKTYEITTYENTDNNGSKIFGYTFRNVKTDNYIYTNGIFENVLMFAKGFACGKGVTLDSICTIR
jgi:hypothetical protein